MIIIEKALPVSGLALLMTIGLGMPSLFADPSFPAKCPTSKDFSWVQKTQKGMKKQKEWVGTIISEGEEWTQISYSGAEAPSAQYRNNSVQKKGNMTTFNCTYNLFMPHIPTTPKKVVVSLTQDTTGYNCTNMSKKQSFSCQKTSGK